MKNKKSIFLVLIMIALIIVNIIYEINRDSFSNDADDSMYGKYVQVDLSENAELAEYVRSHSGENMLVTYTMDGSEETVDTVVPDSITLN